MRRYESVKVTTDEAKRTLLDTIGARYGGERYFEVVDRVYTRVETGFIPIYDVRLSLSKGLSLRDLRSMYTRLRAEDIGKGWCVLFLLLIRLLIPRGRYISLVEGFRQMEAIEVVIDEEIQRHVNVMMDAVDRKPIPWGDFS
jgi:hypothetical protein